MVEQPRPPPLNFEAIEHQQNLDNLAGVADEIAQQSERLRIRILHFASQNEVQALLQNFLPRLNNDVALFILVDGPYYTDASLGQLRGLMRLQNPRSYVASVNQLLPILREIAAAHPE